MPAGRRNFSDWITTYLDYTVHSESPLDFHRWTAIGTIAGALRRRVRLEMGYFRWFPNFFLCFVAPPGIVSKSTTADIGMSLLRRVPGIKFGPAAVTWQALVTSLAESREDFPTASGVYVPMCALTIVASELGTLIQPGDQSILTVLTEFWDGKDDVFQKRTKKDGDELVTNPWVSLIGCTTPAWIAENFNSYFIGGGFASRTLFIYGEHKRQLVAYPASRITPAQATLADKLVEDLEQISTMEGPFRLAPEALEWGEDWYQRHFASDNPLRLDNRFGGYFARKQAHLHKTAMVLSASRGGGLVISARDLQDAERYISGLEPNMLSVFGEMNKEKITDQMAQVLSTIRDAGRIRRNALYQEYMVSMGYTTFNECINGLLQAGLVDLIQEANGFVLHYKADEIVQRVMKG